MERHWEGAKVKKQLQEANARCKKLEKEAQAPDASGEESDEMKAKIRALPELANLAFEKGLSDVAEVHGSEAEQLAQAALEEKPTDNQIDKKTKTKNKNK